MRPNEAIAKRAQSLIGARFRPQGRSAAEGLDCVGLVAAAIGAPPPPQDYALRGGDAARLADGLRTAGFRLCPDRQAGDVVVMQSGPGQLHLGVRTGGGIVHADAALRRVVERPGVPPWPVIQQWRRED